MRMMRRRDGSKGANGTQRHQRPGVEIGAVSGLARRSVFVSGLTALMVHQLRPPQTTPVELGGRGPDQLSSSMVAVLNLA